MDRPPAVHASLQGQTACRGSGAFTRPDSLYGEPDRSPDWRGPLQRSHPDCCDNAT